MHINDDKNQENEEIIEDSAQSTDPSDSNLYEEMIETDEEGNPISGNSPAALKKLREKLAKAIEEKQQYLNNWQKDKAEFINIRKRDESDKKEFLQFAEQKVVEDLLPTIDTFETALKHSQGLDELGDAAINFKKGIEGIYQNFVNTLAKRGVIQFGEVNETFDHNLHHSIAVESTDDKALDGKISEVLQKGYKMNERVIRAALVKVYESK